MRSGDSTALWKTPDLHGVVGVRGTEKKKCRKADLQGERDWLFCGQGDRVECSQGPQRAWGVWTLGLEG